MPTSLTPCVRAEKGPQFRSEYVHIQVLPVCVRLVRPRLVQLPVVRAPQALAVADHVADPNVEPVDEPCAQLERRAELRPVVEDLAVRGADMLDPDRDVVEPDGVAAHDVQAHELVDPAAPADDEVRARPG